MYMDDYKLFTKNEKELETLIYAVRIYSQRHWYKIWHRKLRHANSEKRDDRRNGTTKSGKN